MFTSTPLTLLTFIMESVKKLDPTLIAFWEGFPCPPPWKEELLFRLNWTGCVGPEMGEKVKMYMADKCNIRTDGKSVLSEPTEVDDDGVMVKEECGPTCQLVIGIISILFIVLLLIAVIVCVRRHKAKPLSPSHQSSLTSHPDYAKYYTSCHYACAPVVARQLQTTLNGDRTDTSVLTSAPNTTNGQYHPGTYSQHNCQQMNYHHYRRHQLKQPCLIITPYGQVPSHTSSLVVPQHSSFRPGQFRKLDGLYSSSSIANSDQSPVYESIGDNDSIRERARGRRTSVSECEFCECGGDHSSDQNDYTGYHEPIILNEDKTHCGVGTNAFGQPGLRGYSDSKPVCLSQNREEPPEPCPPMFKEDFYGEKCPQTLPLRPLRGNIEIKDGKTTDLKDNILDESSPLQHKNSGSQTAGDDGSNSDIRRRPSTASSFSNNGSPSPYREGNANPQRRVIPALHPNYFISSYEEIS